MKNILKVLILIIPLFLLDEAYSMPAACTSTYASTADAFCNSPTITQNGACVSGTNTAVTACLTGGCFNSLAQDFMQFTATTTSVDIDFTSTGISTADVGIITNGAGGCGDPVSACPAIGGLCILSCNTSVGGGNLQITETGLTIGETYYIAIESSVANSGTFNICVSSNLCFNGIMDGGETGIDCGGPCGPCGGGAGDDCASADRLTCGDPVSAGETTIGLTDIEDDWACSTLLGANPYPGLDHFYVVQWPDAVNGGSIRLDFTNVADADATLMEVLALGSTCAPDACVNSSQLTIATGLFGTGNTFIEFTVGPGIADYYFVVDSQGDGVDDAIDTYDIQAICFATGIELDVNNNCAPIPATAPANQGYYVTWDGAEPPATADAATLAAGGPYTICENIYIENPAGWEWLKDFDITLGACWINVSNLSPSGNNNGFYNPLGDWTSSIGGGSPTVLNWNFAHSSNATWGDGAGPAYSCNLYTFCYDADVDPTCVVSTGLQNGVSASDDGIGGGGGGAVNPGNVTVGSTSPTVLPVTLLSFNAKAVEKEGEYGVVLNWRTSSEINNDYFTIERSKDGVEFEELFNIPGAGNSNNINNYISVDENPYNGVSYYRLKQTDYNGKVEYFDMVAVDISNITNLKLYPNPVNSILTLSLESKLENSPIKLSIYNAQGRLILNQSSSLDKGMNNIQLNMEKYSQGMYFISIEHGGDVEHLKFTKE
jgi:hypothetical protein